MRCHDEVMSLRRTNSQHQTLAGSLSDINPGHSFSTLHFDGSANPNPGDNCVAGYVLHLPNGQVHRGRNAFGKGTNNIAEYKGLIDGLTEALRQGVTHLEVYGDSMLVINGMKKGYNPKGKPHLEKLKREALDLSKLFREIHYSWVPREQNADADSMTATRPVREDFYLSHLRACAAGV